MTKAERRFLRSWEEQREGGRWKYYLPYTMAWTFMLMTFSFVLFTIYSNVLKNPWNVLIQFCCCTVVGFVVALLGWSRGERKFKDIIRRVLKESSKKEI